MAVFNFCCGCISLRNGSIILGVISLVSSTFILMLNSLAIYALGESGKNFTQVAEVDLHSDDDSTLAYGIVLVGLSLVGIACSVLLIIGAMKKRKNFLIPYLVIGGIVCLLTVLSIFIALATGEGGYGTTSAVLLLSFNLAVNSYFWLCVFSLYQSYRDEEAGQPSQPNLEVSYSQVPKA